MHKILLGFMLMSINYSLLKQKTIVILILIISPYLLIMYSFEYPDVYPSSSLYYD